ncbi:PilW family protein [Pseudoduganella sp. R-34]|uniref:PilW family protein n=1 Tax=unclassified Pseudoduganella TaxID=2637179 RepID=UPI003CF8A4E5
MQIHRRRAQGFTLVEMMVAVAVGLLLLAGLSTLFNNNSAAQMEIERANRQVENGRYAMQLMTGDLRNAGYYAEYDPVELAAPTVLPDPCTLDLTAIRGDIAFAVQGYDNSNSLGCLSDVKANTDVVVVRHTQTCVVGAADCEDEAAGGPFFQASQCSNDYELGSSDKNKHYQISEINNGFTLHQYNCTAAINSGTPADVRRLLTHIYFVANNSMARDGVPTLKRAEVVSKGGVMSVQIVPLAEGIENMQLEYGLDTSGDGVADSFTPHVNDTEWGNVVSVKLHLLARTLSPSVGHTDRKSYVLGANENGQQNVISAANDKYKRHVFTSLIGLPNVAGRKS